LAGERHQLNYQSSEKMRNSKWARCVWIGIRASRSKATNEPAGTALCTSAPQSTWEPSPAGLIHLPDFDWKEFDEAKGGRAAMRVGQLREALGKDIRSGFVFIHEVF
jgi:hypothetical protein